MVAQHMDLMELLLMQLEDQILHKDKENKKEEMFQIHKELTEKVLD